MNNKNQAFKQKKNQLQPQLHTLHDLHKPEKKPWKEMLKNSKTLHT
jgi:hypothetical protein